jgi:serine/threonine protein kinase
MTDEPGNQNIVSDNLIDNRYLVRELLGEGAIGRTYLALDTHRFNEPCVLKEFAPSGRGKLHLQKAQELFKTEAKILLQLKHPQIPKLLACFESQNRLFLIQEYVSGKTYTQLLQERFQQGRAFEEAEVIKLAIELLPVFSYIHDRGIVHRDISPDNIIQPDDRQPPVLIDFGVGKLVVFDSEETQNSNSQKSLAGTMSFVGKIGYAPHEQISMGICSPASDLYALGVTSIVLLTGKQPTALIDRETLEWQWRSHIDVSESFAAIVNKLLAARPKNRYQSAQELLSDLEQLRPTQKTIVIPSEVNEDREFNNNWDRRWSEAIDSSPTQQQTNQPFFASSELTIPEISEGFSGHSDRPVQPPTNYPSLPTRDLYGSDRHDEQPLPELPTKLQIDDRYEKLDTSIFRIESTPPNQPLPPSQFSPPTQPLPPSQFSPPTQPSPQINSSFIDACQEKLAYYIGPMAVLIVEDLLSQNPNLSPQELVTILAEEIPDYKGAQEFRHSFNRS